MNLPLFLARRVRHAAAGSFSVTVTRIGIATIAVGVAVMLVAFAVLFGFKDTIQQKIFVFGGHLQAVKFTMNQSYETPPLPLHTKLYEQAEQLPGVQHIQTTALKAGILKTPTDLAGGVLKGVGLNYDWHLLRESLVAGKLPNMQVDTGGGGLAYSKEILMSQSMANQLQIKVGERVIMYFISGAIRGGSASGGQLRPRPLTVAGIYETGIEEGDKNIVIGDLRLVQRVNNWGPDSVGAFEIFVNDFAQLDQMANRVFDLISPDMRLLKVTDQYRPLFDWMHMLDRTTSILIILIVVVIAINMIAVLLVLMLERTPMIGLLKALGSPDPLLRRLFLYVGLNMVGWGLLIGNGLGLGICWGQYQFRIIPLDPTNYYMHFVPIRWDWPTILAINGATIALIALVIWVATLVITRIRPVRALVFKA